MREDAARRASLGDVPDSVWAALAGRRIFFGHQSVGTNVMEGVVDVVRAEPRIGLRVVESDEAFAAAPGAFAHWRIGRNGEPRLKTDEFAGLVDGRLSGRVDVAFHKYCFADIHEGTDVDALFDHYRTTMSRLGAAHPNVVFAHVTVPLVRVQSGPRVFLKKLLGRSPGRFGSNLARERFNERMRRTYAGREPVFDLAAIESTRPDGRRETVRFRGGSVPTLVGAYTADGSHLNEAGRRRAGEQLLLFLAQCCATR